MGGVLVGTKEKTQKYDECCLFVRKVTWSPTWFVQAKRFEKCLVAMYLFIHAYIMRVIFHYQTSS